MTSDTRSNLSSTPVRAIAVTAGRSVPSRRFRIKEIVPYLRERGVQLDELCPRFSSYPPPSRVSRPLWLAGAISERASYIWRTTGYDVVILQRELISTIATFESRLPRPMVFDVDDAIFIHRNGAAAKKISGNSSLVVCGNNYLAEQFSQWNRNVAVIPTGVDTEALRPRRRDADCTDLTIGWIGTSGNYRFLESISAALTRVLQINDRVRLQIISDRYPEPLRHIGGRLDYRVWRPGIEMELLPDISIGLMPLADDEWSRGKCAFKMLQYMAAGVPVVVSPVGMNREILLAREVGIGASTDKEWSESLLSLLDCEEERKRLGSAGRQLAVSEYSLSKIAFLWKQQLEQIV